jgi:hypothetical protein
MEVRIFFGILILAFSAPLAHAYDEYSHEWITRSALDYLREHSHEFPETDAWVQKLGPQRGFAEEALVRSVVDTDYRADVWLDAWFHSPFVGAYSDGAVTVFTTLFHFLNVTVPGDYWDHDGFAYRHSTQQGNDTYLNYFSVSVEGDQSPPLGGRAPADEVYHGANLGVYNTGFKGKRRDWRDLFMDSFGGDAVFPPSTVPAQIAYNTMLRSNRATNDSTDAWSQNLPLVTGLFSTEYFQRNYWRGEISGLPQDWDLLGMVMHLTQDATVPFHVEGTSDNCHPEYESMLDQVTCASTESMDRSAYYNGTYSGARAGCGALYDPELVGEILSQYPAMSARSGDPIAARMVEVAMVSSQWKWRTHHNHRYTTLPDGATYKGKQCSDLFSIQAVMDQAKFHYNLAIAETVAIFESAAHDYEPAHAYDPPSQLAQIANWFTTP